MKKLIIAAGAAAALLAGCGEGAGGATGGGRDAVWAAGSSTVFPFTTRVAENFARRAGGAAPRVESLGTGGGIAAFCAGVGAQTPDIANASRPMKASEFDACVANGVTDIIEIQIGFDGIVVATARSGADYALQGADLYLALAKEVPGGEGFVANPNTTWSSVRAGLPGDRIQVYGPPPTSGTRDSWLELAMAPSAEDVPQLAALAESDEDRFETLAHTLREDGAWIDSGENDNAIVQTLTRTPGSIGVFGFSFLEENMDTVKAATINGVAPTIETIASGEYPISRSMFIYVKKAHLDVTPGLREFVQEYLSDGSMGRGGYLQDRGLIPLSADRLTALREAFAAGTVMTRPAG
jgi:phosphate transport system substrate-binding protein